MQAGGHIGIWSEYLAGFYDRVFSFEPNPILYKCLERNLEGINNVHCCNVALGNEHSTVTLHQAHKSGGDSIKPTAHGNYTETHEVEQYSIDDVFIQTDVGTIILDVERYEDVVLKGAEKTIKKCRPAIQVELDPVAADDIHDVLLSYDYELYKRVGSRDSLYLHKEHKK